MTASFVLLDMPDGCAVHFSGLLKTLAIRDAESFALACQEAETANQRGLHVAAVLDYELGSVFEPNAGTMPVPAGPQAAVLGHFWIFADRHHLNPEALAAFLATLAGDPPAPATVVDFQPQLDASMHASAVARIRDYIAAGDCYQVNFTFPFTGTCAGDPLALYVRLRKGQPVSCGGLVVTPEICLLSFSPELFIERASGVIRASPMKGTAPRGVDADADARIRNNFLASAKDRAENVMIVDLIRNDLGRIAVPGSVRVESMCEVETYPSVHQMTSTVSARSDADLATVLAALFPCGSITGAPKIRAMQIIRELESGPRGYYTGAVGWIGRGGDFRFNVAIRSLQVTDDHGVRYGVGGGIVWDSEPAAEYAECLLKARFVTDVDPGFHLIETLRLHEGIFPMLALHLERLHASAFALAFACELSSIEAALQDVAKEHFRGCHRVRLTLTHAGKFSLAVFPLSGDEPGGRGAGLGGVRLQALISPRCLDSGSPWLRHKTSVRNLYDGELARLAVRPEVFDAIFLNERGEVCEGARSSVFLRRQANDPLLTPPLSSGLLPGVLRRHLLATGEAVETVLYESDLHSAAELYLGNALRGLVPVKLVDPVTCADV